MSTRFRRSIKLMPGVKLNLNKDSISLTAGVKGAHYTINSKGTSTSSVGIPGSGLSYISKSNINIFNNEEEILEPGKNSTIKSIPLREKKVKEKKVITKEMLSLTKNKFITSVISSIVFLMSFICIMDINDDIGTILGLLWFSSIICTIFYGIKYIIIKNK